MPSPAPSRRTGILSAWDDSKNRGTVLISETSEPFFICKRFIISGEPIVGSGVVFTPLPAVKGMTFPQAAFAVIDNGKSASARVVAAPDSVL